MKFLVTFLKTKKSNKQFMIADKKFQIQSKIF